MGLNYSSKELNYLNEKDFKIYNKNEIFVFGCKSSRFTSHNAILFLTTWAKISQIL
jgi:hypothetical protein